MAVDAAAMAAATESGAAPASANTEATPTAPEAAAPAIDVWAEALKLDPDELVRRYPALQGKVGALAQQQSQRAMQEYRQQQEAQAASAAEATKRAQLKDLAARDPDALALRVQTDLITQEYQEQQNRLLEAQQGEMQRALASRLDRVMQTKGFQEVWAESDEATRAKLSWTNYREMDEFFEAANDIIAEHRAERRADAKAEKLFEKRQAALKAEGAIDGVKSDAADGGAGLNLDGLSGADHIFSVSEIRANQTDPAWRKANLAKINLQYRAGLIRPD